MKSYTITVNGNVYDVTVEENGAGAAAPAPVRRPAAPVPAPAPAAAPAPAGGAGNVRVEAGAAGKVFSVDSKPGDSLKRGDTILVLEVMKMETPVVAPEDGTVATIDVAVGQAVEAGALLATLNN
ncbi:MAG: acetyl-CoA carboxylase biotin carboxyl carrier protein subunit [Lachnospiraceae bacterium]|nr:acetyl-CoA carboxylase biotin carboxyl carrier protein subunit [Lachnospiraceae bacterium]